MTLRADQPIVTFGLATEAYEIRPGDKLHLNAIDVSGQTVVVFVEAPGNGFRAFLKQAEPVLDSMDF